MFISHERVRHCPLCNNDEFVKDFKRDELYCNKCGLVLQSAVQWVGLEKIDNEIPYSPPYDARRGIHTRYNSTRRRTKNYRHNISDKDLMKKGKK